MTQVCLEDSSVHRGKDLCGLRGTRKSGHYLIRPTAFESLHKVDRDVRERQQLEQQLRRARRLETAGLIAGQTAHDLRNLSGVLIGYAELIKETLPHGHEAEAFCDAMKRAAQRIVDINTDMLTLSRGGLP